MLGACAASLAAAGLSWRRAARAGPALEAALADERCHSKKPAAMPVAARLPERLTFAGTRLFKEGFLDEMAEAYQRHSGRRIDVLGGGCDDGIAAVRGRHAHIGGLCCPLRGSAAEGLDHIRVGQDIKAVLAHPWVPLRSVRLADLKAAFAGRVANWRALGGPDRPLALVVHDHCPDYLEPVRELVATPVPGRGTPQTLFAKTDQKHLELLERFEFTLGINSWVLAEPLVAAGRLKRIAVDGVVPNIDTVQQGRYRLVGPMNMIFGAWVPELMEPFFTFLFSDAGRRLVARRMVPAAASQSVWRRGTTGARA